MREVVGFDHQAETVEQEEQEAQSSQNSSFTSVTHLSLRYLNKQVRRAEGTARTTCRRAKGSTLKTLSAFKRDLPSPKCDF